MPKKHHAVVIKHKFLLILIALILFFFINAAVSHDWLIYANMVVITILVAASLLSLEGHNRFTSLFGFALGIAGIVISGFTTVKNVPDSVLITRLAILIGFFSIIAAICLYSTLSRRKVTVNVLCGATASYLLIGFVFANIYSLIHVINPAAFNIQSISHDDSPLQIFTYFSFITLTTLGYGDITPVTNLARTFSWLEAAFGQIYLTVLIAQLVGSFIAQKGRLACDTSSD